MDNGIVFYDKERRKKKVDLVVLRINKNDELRNARPCKHCLDTMKELECIDKIYYSTGNNDDFIMEKVNRMISNHISYGNKVSDYISININKKSNKYTKNKKVQDFKKIINSVDEHDVIDNWINKYSQVFNKSERNEFQDLVNLDLFPNYANAINREIYYCPNGHFYIEIIDKSKRINYKRTFCLNNN